MQYVDKWKNKVIFARKKNARTEHNENIIRNQQEVGDQQTQRNETSVAHDKIRPHCSFRSFKNTMS